MSLNKDNEKCNLCGRDTTVLFNTLRYCQYCEADNTKKTPDKPLLDPARIDFDEITIKIDDYMY